jgi:hypothetical protein
MSAATASKTMSAATKIMSAESKMLMLDSKVMSMVSKILILDSKVMSMVSKILTLDSEVMSVSFCTQRRGDVEPPSGAERATASPQTWQAVVDTDQDVAKSKRM